MSNIEVMYSACRELLCRTIYFIKKTEQSETTLRHSAVRYSTFCGLFLPGSDVFRSGLQRDSLVLK